MCSVDNLSENVRGLLVQEKARSRCPRNLTVEAISDLKDEMSKMKELGSTLCKVYMAQAQASLAHLDGVNPPISPLAASNNKEYKVFSKEFAPYRVT